MSNKLVNEYIQTFGAQYALNDPAHQLEHFADVLNHAREINEHLQLGYPDYLLIHFAYSHDLFAAYRQKHHLLSAVFALSDHPIYKDLAKEEQHLVSDGCMYHRASMRAEYPHEFAELCASADRGAPKNHRMQLKRACLYRCSDLSQMTLEVFISALEHVREKFGDPTTYPKMYLDHYGTSFLDQYRDMDVGTEWMVFKKTDGYRLTSPSERCSRELMELTKEAIV